MQFHPKLKNKLTAILFAILPAIIIGGLVYGANVYYDLDSDTIKTNEISEMTKDFTVSGTGNILFSTSGTIEQTGAGQVTFDGNLDADNGLDVTGIATLGDGGTTNYASFSNVGDLTFVGTADTIQKSDGALTINTTGQNLTVSTTTTGDLVLTSAELFDLNASANLDIDVTGTYDMLASGVFSIDGTGASNVSATTGGLTLSTLTSGNLILTSVADVDLTATNFDIDAGTIDLSTQTVDVTLNAAADALNFDSNTLSIDASSDRVGIGTAAPTAKLELEVASADAATGMLIDQDGLAQIGLQITQEADATASALDISTLQVSGNVINTSWSAAEIQQGALAGMSLDFSNLTSLAGSTTYGLHINDLAAQTSSTEYGIYQQGTLWDYGIYAEDDVYFNTALTVNGDLDANGLFTLGDGVETGAINTLNWDISATGEGTGFDSWVVDNITLDGATITSDTGTISFNDENLTTTGTITGGALTTPYAQTKTVAKSGGDYATIQAAIDALTCSAASPCLVRVMPGVYAEQVTINDKSYIDVVSSGGPGVTRIVPASGSQAVLVSGTSGHVRVEGFGVEMSN